MKHKPDDDQSNPVPNSTVIAWVGVRTIRGAAGAAGGGGGVGGAVAPRGAENLLLSITHTRWCAFVCPICMYTFFFEKGHVSMLFERHERTKKSDFKEGFLFQKRERESVNL